MCSLRKTKSVIKECKIHGLTEYAVISTTGGTYCRKCKAEQSKQKRNNIRKLCYEYLGNKCSKCNEKLDIYEFHHINEKEKLFEISEGIVKNLSFKKLKPELDKCILVCPNCHQEIHFNENHKNDNKNIMTNYMQKYRDENKQRAIKYLGGKCSKCGYNKCQAALSINKYENDTLENIGEILQHSWENIKPILDKCYLLCMNCNRKKFKK